MAPRTISIYAFCSVKGGVGKSTLAVASAALLSQRGTCVLIDADLSGTSLADGLRLCTPVLLLPEDGRLDVRAPANGLLRFHDRDTTQRLRAKRKLRRSPEAAYLPYFNDVMNVPEASPETDAAVERLYWRHEDDRDQRGPLFFPSSSLRVDMAAALDWLYDQEQNLWLCRLTWVLLNLLSRLPDLSSIILDLPPGTFGFPHEVIQLMSYLSTGRSLPGGYPDFAARGIVFRAGAMLVLSSDQNDLCAGMEYLADFRPRVPALRPVVNRPGTSLEELRKLVKVHLDQQQGSHRLEGLLRHQVPFVDSWGHLFRTGDLPQGSEALEQLLELEGP